LRYGAVAGPGASVGGQADVAALFRRAAVGFPARRRRFGRAGGGRALRRGRLRVRAPLDPGDDQPLPRLDDALAADAVGLADRVHRDAVALGDRAKALPAEHGVHLSCRRLGFSPPAGVPLARRVFGAGLAATPRDHELLTRTDDGAAADAVFGAERLDAHVVALGDRPQALP